MTLLEEHNHLDKLIAEGKYSTLDIDTLNDMYDRLRGEISLMTYRLSRIDLAAREAKLNIWEEKQQPANGNAWREENKGAA